jgi:hypothetical protein
VVDWRQLGDHEGIGDHDRNHEWRPRGDGGVGSVTATTNQQVNADKLHAALQAIQPGAAFSSVGGELASTDSKVVTAHDATDDQLQQAITTAAAEFVDVPEVQAEALAGLQTMLGEKNAWAQQGQADIAALQVAAQPDWTVLGPLLVRVVEGLLSTMQAHEDHLTVNGII